MGVFDLFSIVVAAVGYSIGRSRGLVWQLSGIFTLILGGLTATILSNPVGPLFAEGILGRFVAWIVIYVVVGVCLYVLTLRLKDKIKEMEFEELDKRFGGMLGGFKALCIFSLFVLVAVAISDNVGEAVNRSATGKTLGYLVHEMRPLVPDKIHDAFDKLQPREDAPAEPTPPSPTQPGSPTQPASPLPPSQPLPPAQPVTPPRPTTDSPTFQPGPRPTPLGPPRPNPFETRAPSLPTDPSAVQPLEPSPDINVPEIQPLPADDDEPDDPFDTTGDDADPLAPKRD